MVMNASNVAIRRVNVSGVMDGIGLFAVINGSVTSSTVASLFTGIGIGIVQSGTTEYRSSQFAVAGNDVTVLALHSVGVTVAANDSIVSGNVVRGAESPYTVAISDNVTVSHNLALGGGSAGIEVRSSSHVRVESNDFIDLAAGADAILEYRSSSVRTVGNLFRGLGSLALNLITADAAETYHNNFEGSAITIWDGGLDAWDDGYPSGGNYWSDYTGADLCSGENQSVCTVSDGIGDSPRLTSGVNNDRYPLMQPYPLMNFVPTAVFTASASAVNATTPVHVDGSGSTDGQDPSAALEVRWAWEDDGVWDTAWSSVKTADHLYPTPGTYRIRMAVRDTSGFTSEAARSVMVDNEPPAVTATPAGVAGNSGWFRSSVTVTLRAVDNLSGLATVRYRVDGGPWLLRSASTGSLSLFTLTVGEGIHVVEYVAIDAVGNPSPTRALHISADATAPVITSLTPGGRLSTSRVTLSWAGTDTLSGIAGYRMSVDGGAYVDLGTTTQRELSLADGTHEAVLEAFDVAGNSVSATTTFQIDAGSANQGGPSNGTFLIAAVAAASAIVVAVLLVILWRGRRRNTPPGNP